MNVWDVMSNWQPLSCAQCGLLVWARKQSDFKRKTEMRQEKLQRKSKDIKVKNSKTETEVLETALDTLGFWGISGTLQKMNSTAPCDV